MDPSASRVFAFSAHRPATPSVRGHSMTNLLTTLAIAGAVTGGAPAVQNLVHEQRLVAHANQLFGDLHLARSEAIKRAGQVTLCKSSDGASCSTSSRWQDGWIVFVDADGDESVDSGEQIIRVQQALDSGVTLRFGETGTYRYVRYKSDGTAWPNATFTFCDPRGAANARGIVVWQTGRVRVWDRSSDGALACS